MTNGVGLPISEVSPPVSKDQEPSMCVTLALVASALAFFIPWELAGILMVHVVLCWCLKSNLGHT